MPTPTLVQSTSKNPGSVASTSLALASPVTPGNFLVAYAFQATTGATFTLSDTVDGPYGAADVSGTNAPHNIQAGIYTFHNAIGGATTVSFGSSVSAQMRLILEEWSGIDTISPLDQIASGFGGSSTTPASGNTPSTTEASELALGLICCTSGAATFTAGSGWTTDLTISSRLCSEYQVLSSIGAQNANGTLSSGDFWLALCATYKTSGGGGGGGGGGSPGGLLLRRCGS